MPSAAPMLRVRSLGRSRTWTRARCVTCPIRVRHPATVGRVIERSGDNAANESKVFKAPTPHRGIVGSSKSSNGVHSRLGSHDRLAHGADLQEHLDAASMRLTDEGRRIAPEEHRDRNLLAETGLDLPFP